jgi:plastocyanin
MKKIIMVLGILIILLFPILFLPACSSPEKKSAATEPGTTQNVNNVDTVTIQLMKFNPATLTVTKGDAIVWVNKGLVAHTVKSYAGNKFYSDTVQPGKSDT